MSKHTSACGFDWTVGTGWVLYDICGVGTYVYAQKVVMNVLGNTPFMGSVTATVMCIASALFLLWKVDSLSRVCTKNCMLSPELNLCHICRYSLPSRSMMLYAKFYRTGSISQACWAVLL